MERVTHYRDRATDFGRDVVTEETFRLNTKEELMADAHLRETWIELLQRSEQACFARSPDMQTAQGIKENNQRIRDIIEDGFDYEALAGVFQTFDGAVNDPFIGATDYTVLSIQNFNGRIVINEVCRVKINKTKASPTRSLLKYVEEWLLSQGVHEVSMFVEDPLLPGQTRTGGPVSINGQTLLSIYGNYGYTFDGWLDDEEFIMSKRLSRYSLRSRY